MARYTFPRPRQRWIPPGHIFPPPLAFDFVGPPDVQGYTDFAGPGYAEVMKSQRLKILELQEDKKKLSIELSETHKKLQNELVETNAKLLALESKKDNKKLQAEVEASRSKLAASQEAHQASIAQCSHYQQIVTQLVKDCDALRKHIEELESEKDKSKSKTGFSDPPQPPPTLNTNAEKGSIQYSSSSTNPELNLYRPTVYSKNTVQVPFGKLNEHEPDVQITGFVNKQLNSDRHPKSCNSNKPSFSFCLPTTPLIRSSKSEGAYATPGNSNLDVISEPVNKRSRFNESMTESGSAFAVKQKPTINTPTTKILIPDRHEQSLNSNYSTVNKNLQPGVSSQAPSAPLKAPPIPLKSSPVSSKSSVVPSFPANYPTGSTKGPYVTLTFTPPAYDNSNSAVYTTNPKPTKVSVPFEKHLVDMAQCHVTKLFDNPEDHKLVKEAYDEYIADFSSTLNTVNVVEMNESMLNWLAKRGKIWSLCITADFYRVKFLLFELIRLVVATMRNLVPLNDIRVDIAKVFAQDLVNEVEVKLKNLV